MDDTIEIIQLFFFRTLSLNPKTSEELVVSNVFIKRKESEKKKVRFDYLHCLKAFEMYSEYFHI